jgi:uncharacterized protein (UPF0276 family)
VSIDVDGDVWMVDYNGWAYKIDPETYVKELVTDRQRPLHVLGHDRRRAQERDHARLTAACRRSTR